jgi:hypothetical protein
MQRRANRQKLGTLDAEFRSRLVARKAGEAMHGSLPPTDKVSCT